MDGSNKKKMGLRRCSDIRNVEKFTKDELADLKKIKGPSDEKDTADSDRDNSEDEKDDDK